MRWGEAKWRLEEALIGLQGSRQGLGHGFRAIHTGPRSSLMQKRRKAHSKAHPEPKTHQS